jgi:hypothetical protein
MKTPVIHTLADVDWANFDYGTFKGRMHDGAVIVHLYQKLGELHDTISHRLRSVTYGDKRKSAAIVIERSMWIESLGSASVSSEIHVYKLAGGKPALVGIIDVGTPVHDVRFEAHGKVFVSSGEPPVLQRFRFVDGEFLALPQQA